MPKPTLRIAVLLLAAGVAVPTLLAEPPAQNPVPLSEGKKARRERQEKEREAQKENGGAGSDSGVQSFRRQSEPAPDSKAGPSSDKAAPDKVVQVKRDQFLARYDTNGDGKISSEEWRAADPEGLTFETYMAERFKTLSETAKAELVKRWDANSDGRLDDKELNAWREHWQAERMELLARFDADKDGKLNDAERKAMVEALKAKRDEKQGAQPDAKQPSKPEPKAPAAPTGDKK